VADEDGGGLLSDPSVLLQHVKEMKQERDKANTKRDQVSRLMWSACDHHVISPGIQESRAVSEAAVQSRGRSEASTGNVRGSHCSVAEEIRESPKRKLWPQVRLYMSCDPS